MNKKVKKLLIAQSKTVYGLSKVLEISPQAAEYVVKKKDLSADYNRLKKIANYLECDINGIIDNPIK